MNNCRICGEPLHEPVYHSAAQSITSVRSVSHTSLTVYMCPNCLHVQKPSLPSTPDYYERLYRISLESDDFDQLYDKVDDKCIYRTDYQAELVKNHVDLPPGAEILDYGAGKATTLMKIVASRPDLVPYVFDVSDDYKKYWQVLPPDRQAVCRIPDSWKSRFSLIMAHFVLEHVENPCLFFSDIAKLLTERGQVFFTVPDLLTNPGDLIAVDHINHFSFRSIGMALRKSGLSLVRATKGIFRGAIVCLATTGGASCCHAQDDSLDFANKVNGIVRFWRDFDTRLDSAVSRYNSNPTAIFGAGVYGSYIASKIKDLVFLRCFLDNSLHLRNSVHMGFPVYAPQDMPDDIRVIYSGLNPSIARDVLTPLHEKRGMKIIYFDKGDFPDD